MFTCQLLKSLRGYIHLKVKTAVEMSCTQFFWLCFFYRYICFINMFIGSNTGPRLDNRVFIAIVKDPVMM